MTQTVGKDHGTRGTIGTHGSVTGHKQHGPLRHMCTNSTALPLFVWRGGVYKYESQERTKRQPFIRVCGAHAAQMTRAVTCIKTRIPSAQLDRIKAVPCVQTHARTRTRSRTHTHACRQQCAARRRSCNMCARVHHKHMQRHPICMSVTSAPAPAMLQVHTCFVCLTQDSCRWAAGSHPNQIAGHGLTAKNKSNDVSHEGS